ncbi:MAG: glycosyltransferase, partial [Candidatus Hydrogenedentales bacterium]
FCFQHVESPYIVTLSQDAIPAHGDWLENLLAPLDADAQIAASCGASLPDPQRGYPQFAWERNGWFYFTAEMKRFGRGWGRGLSFSNTAIRRSAWQQCRLEPIVLGEDFQFQQKVLAAGWRIAFAENAAVLHHHEYTLRTLWRRCRDEGAALEALGCPYRAADVCRDASRAALYAQWARELRRGAWRSPAATLFPWLRPLAVYAGNRRARNESPRHAHALKPQVLAKTDEARP